MTAFGRLEDGRAVDRVRIGSDRLRVELLSYGARFHSVRLDAGPEMVLAGTLADYAGRLRFAGPIVGPVANRIGQAEAVIDGVLCRFEANEGRTCLHSGSTGLHAQVWDIAEAAPDRVRFSCLLPDGLGGFPGTRRIDATYTVRGAAIDLDLRAGTDRPTLMNLASHGVWDLDGTRSRDGHRLQLMSAEVLPVDAAKLPLGPVVTAGTAGVAGGTAGEAAVEAAGTSAAIAAFAAKGLDYREWRTPGADLDHNFCFPEAGAPRLMARLRAASGRSLDVLSDARGLQAFGGWPTGVALEPQLWPDAPGRPSFPSILLMPGAVFRQTTRFAFRAPGEDAA